MVLGSPTCLLSATTRSWFQIPKIQRDVQVVEGACLESDSGDAHRAASKHALPHLQTMTRVGAAGNRAPDLMTLSQVCIPA